MSNRTKIILTAAGICCIAGIVICMIASIFGGAKGTAVSFSNDGVSAGDSVELVSDTVKLEEFDELSYEFGDYDFSMVQGDEYSLEYTVTEDKIPQIRQNGKSLSIIEPKNNSLFLLWNVNTPKREVILTVPKNDKEYVVDGSTASGSAKFNGICIKGKLKLSSGDIVVSDSKTKEDLEIKIASGDARFSGCEYENMKVDMSSGDATIEGSTLTNLFCHAASGSYELNNIKADKFTCEMNSGGMDGQKITTDDLLVDVKSGDVNLELVGKADEYKLDIDKSAGSVEINKAEYNSGSFNESGKKNISVDISAGDVNIDFAD